MSAAAAVAAPPQRDSIAVVVRVRPLLAHEIKRRSREIAHVTPDERSVQLNIATHKDFSDVKEFRFKFCASPRVVSELCRGGGGGGRG
jgi:hypothetical protein